MAGSESETRSRRPPRIGWSIKRESSSHKILSRPGWPDVVFAFHDKAEIGPKMLARMAKHTGLEPKDL
jgi:predicted RNA binding protein YcfA (HicA-like mRNA interferase family)